MSQATLSLLDHPVFAEALRDLQAVGVECSITPHAGIQAYAVIGGRSNARWWLIPLANGRVAASGLALFQPLLASARWIKTAATLASRFNMQGLWPGRRIYLSAPTALEGLYANLSPGRALSYAYFTGTDSPHRKVAVQVMDDCGNIKGFVKLSRNPSVKTLLDHEAGMLNHVKTLRLQTAHVPNVLFEGQIGDATVLATDTLKTHTTRSTTHFTRIHKQFLTELENKTATATETTIGDISRRLHERYRKIRHRLDESWMNRLDKAFGILEESAQVRVATSLNHGDFTPWNTFVSGERLYVFDWEYAEKELPITNDLIHFTLNETAIRHQSVKEKYDTLNQALSSHHVGSMKSSHASLLTIYVLTQVLRQIERTPDELSINGWDGDAEHAALMNILVSA